MNVREWVTARSKNVPAELTAKMVEFLGPDGDASESKAAKVCLVSAWKALEGLLAAKRYERDSALDLLAVDALTTFAYEHASESPDGSPDMKSMARDGASSLSTIGNGNV